jgi:hypothetical protein
VRKSQSVDEIGSLASQLLCLAMRHASSPVVALAGQALLVLSQQVRYT